jgi:hypothetical protein
VLVLKIIDGLILNSLHGKYKPSCRITQTFVLFFFYEVGFFQNFIRKCQYEPLFMGYLALRPRFFSLVAEGFLVGSLGVKISLCKPLKNKGYSWKSLPILPLKEEAPLL